MGTWAELGHTLAVFHGAFAVGMTTYPALEAKVTLTNEQVPNAAIEIVALAPISKPEPLTIRVGGYVTLWKF